MMSMSTTLHEYLTGASILRFGQSQLRAIKLLFCNIRNACLSEENSGSLGGKPNAEAMEVIIADAPMQTFAVIHHYGNLCARINE
jgi:hypothetical protein